MVQFGYVYDSIAKEKIIMIILVFDGHDRRGYRHIYCDVKYLSQDYPKSDLFVVRAHDFQKTTQWKEYLCQFPGLFFEEKFSDF